MFVKFENIIVTCGGAGKLLCLRWDSQTAGLREFPARGGKASAPRWGREKFPSGNLLVTESAHPRNQKLDSIRGEFLHCRESPALRAGRWAEGRGTCLVISF